MAVVRCKSLWARRDPRHRKMGYKLVATKALSVSFTLLAPRSTSSTRPIVGIAKTGPKLGSTTALSQDPSNDKYKTMDWEAGREDADGRQEGQCPCAWASRVLTACVPAPPRSTRDG